MQHFARALFLLSRQSGAAGLANESRQLFELSRCAAGEVRSRHSDYRIYHVLAFLLGWTGAGHLSHWVDRLRGFARA